MEARCRAWRRIIRPLVAVALLVSLAVAPAAAQQLTIRFFNVGQGDAALITSPEGKTALIDGGPHSEATRWLSYLPVDTIDLVVGSHNHADHIGGFQYMLHPGTGIAFRRYMDNGRPNTTEVYTTLTDILEADSIPHFNGTPRIIHLGSVNLSLLPIPPEPDEENNASLGILLSYGRFAVMFAGDAETLERNYWESQAHLGHVTVLKVAHHGATNGTDPVWLRTLQPKIAVISVGAKNGFHHPCPATLSLLQQYGVKTYRTDRNGNITITADSTGAFRVTTDR